MSVDNSLKLDPDELYALSIKSVVLEAMGRHEDAEKARKQAWK